MRRVRPAALLLLGILSCTEAPKENARGDEALHTLTRASLDLRGVRPRDAEFEEVEADPERLDALLDDFVADARFPERLVQLYNELYLTRSEALAINVGSLGISVKEPFFQEVGQEPLRLLAQIAAEDLPYTELVTADWTMANETLAAYFPVDYPAGATGWQKVRYTDGRPAVGVLATNGLWWRYVSTASNVNRGRAAVLARLLLCQDFLDRDVDFDASVFLEGEDVIEDALHANPGCVNCHVSLDPLASHFFGFYWSNYTSVQEALRYHADREPLWSTMTGTAPAYYGTPSSGLTELSLLVASDPRLATCAVEQAWTLLLRQEPPLADQEQLETVRAAFLDSGLSIRALYRALMDAPAYRASTDDEGTTPARLASVELLASQVEDLTGFRWVFQDQDLLLSDRYGLHLLGGGVDGISQVAAPGEPNATMILVQEALAEAASSYAVERERALEPGERRLFTEIDLEVDLPDQGAFARQVLALHLRLYSRRVETDGEAVSLARDLWEALYAAEGDPALAWQGLLAAMLRDPDLVLY